MKLSCKKYNSKGHINVNSDFRQFYVDQSKQSSVIEYNGWPQIKIIDIV